MTVKVTVYCYHTQAKEMESKIISFMKSPPEYFVPNAPPTLGQIWSDCSRNLSFLGINLPLILFSGSIAWNWVRKREPISGGQLKNGEVLFKMHGVAGLEAIAYCIF